MARRRMNKRKGFTLLELLLVLALLVLLSAMAWPLMQSQMVAAELPESASRMRSLLYLTRSAAMLEHRRHRIRFSPKDQQPVVEIEYDPILEPGRYVPVDQDWALEPALLEDVQVHRVHPGRPAYLRPVSASEGEAVDPLAVEPVAEEPVSGVESTAAKFQAARSDGLGGQEAEIDERRPLILFEADGSTEWATLVLSRMPPEEELPEDEDQVWVVLDGRTGLATFRDAVTQAQLDDPTFYVQREKLELPETSIDDLTLSIENPGGSAEESQDLSDAMQSMSDLSGQDAGSLQGMDQSALQGGLGQQPTQDASLNPNGLPEQNPEDQKTQEDALSQLEKELANSNLTDEEKEEIRRSFQENQSNEQQDDKKSPS